MDIERARDLFSKHMENFPRELGELPNTPEDRQRLQAAIESYMSAQEPRAKGLALVIAEHWEKFMAQLLDMAQIR